MNLTLLKIAGNLLEKFDIKGTFCEIGCGTGDFLLFLQKKGYKGVGVDLSKESINIAKTKVNENKITLYCDSFENIEGKYDIIFCFNILEHIEDDDMAIKNIKKLLKHNGYLMISVPAHQKLFSHRDLFYGHFRRYEKKELMDLLEQKNGFRIIAFRSYGLKIFNYAARLFMKEQTEKSGHVKLPTLWKIFSPIVSKFDYYILKKSDKGTEFVVICKKWEVE